jgi:hypothetical protein
MNCDVKESSARFIEHKNDPMVEYWPLGSPKGDCKIDYGDANSNADYFVPLFWGAIFYLACRLVSVL